jgi:ATP-dependent helicase HrpA
LSYSFAPGEVNDGVTVRVPVGVLAGVGAEALEWSVPGLLPNLVEQWLRTLPKLKRRVLVPLPDKVDEFSSELLKPERYRQGRLLAALASLLAQRYNLQVSESDWDRERVAQHLLMYVQVVDDQDGVVAAGRDIRVVKTQLAGKAASNDNEAAVAAYTLTALTTFPDTVLKSHQILGDARAPMIKYPGLVDAGDSVDLMLFDDERERDQSHRSGLVRLALTQLGKIGSYFRREIDKRPKLGLHFASLGNSQQLKEELLRNIVWYCFFEGKPLPVSAEKFEQRLATSRAELSEVFNRTVGQFAELMALRFECMRGLDELTSAAYDESKADILAHLLELVPANLLEITPSNYVRLLPRYLLAVRHRIHNLPGHVPKDIKQIREIQPLTHRLQRLSEAELADSQRCLELRFYLEELRMKLFAEQVVRQKVVRHPLDNAFFGPAWKPSTKRIAGQLLAEERRVGLA